jgi:hypothetical protein
VVFTRDNKRQVGEAGKSSSKTGITDVSRKVTGELRQDNAVWLRGL